VTAILDGQQRLTALNIGLYGSHSERQARKWAANPEAYPKRRLYLDITRQDRGDDELGMDYGFRFLTDAEARPGSGAIDRWYRVADILSLSDSGPSMNREVQRRGLADDPTAFQTLWELFKAVREIPSINFYLGKSTDPDKVLDIFVRVNSAGTQLDELLESRYGPPRTFATLAVLYPASISLGHSTLTTSSPGADSRAINSPRRVCRLVASTTTSCASTRCRTSSYLLVFPTSRSRRPSPPTG
jgi:hypothetical protein